MKLERKKAKKEGTVAYPTATQARQDRRHFLAVIGRGLLAAPLAAMASACGIGRDSFQTSGVPRPPEDLGPEEDFTTMGVAPNDIESEPEQYDLAGIAPRDVKEEFPPLAGDMPPPDAISKPDGCPKPGDAEGEFPPLPGEMIEPDVKPDKGEEWPIDGDMPMPDVKAHKDVEEDWPLAGGMGDPSGS